MGVSVATAVAERPGLGVRFVDDSFGNLQDELDAHRVDALVIAVGRTPERRAAAAGRFTGGPGAW